MKAKGLAALEEKRKLKEMKDADKRAKMEAYKVALLIRNKEYQQCLRLGLP